MPIDGITGVHEDTAVAATLLLPQVMVSQLLPATPVCGVHEAAPTGPVMSVGQVRVVQLLPVPAVCGTQLPLGVFSTLFVLHAVVV